MIKWKIAGNGIRQTISYHKSQYEHREPIIVDSVLTKKGLEKIGKENLKLVDFILEDCKTDYLNA